MKNILLPLFLILGCYSTYSQVGIGTPMPNPSAQLDVVSKIKGILIPRVMLTKTDDKGPIFSTPTNSLLVFNENTTATGAGGTVTATDVKPGYYYWYGNKWNRLLIQGEGEKEDVVNTVINNAGDIFNSSEITQILKDIIKANETLTSLTVASSVSAGKTSYTLTYKDEGKIPHTINITDLIGDTTETLTTLTSDTTGTYTYKNEKGDESYITVVADVIKNAGSIFNNLDVINIIKANETLTSLTVASSVSAGKTSYTLTYKDEEGTPNTINITDLIGDTTETLTTLISNGNGTYTYKNEGGDESYITVVADVIKNAGSIFNNLDVINIIKANETLTSLTVASSVSAGKTSYTLTYKDEEGTPNTINITDLIGDTTETLTTLISNGNGTYTYKDEGGEESYITVVADVINNAGNIFNDSDVKNIIKANETLTSLTVVSSVSGTKTVYTLTYKDEKGTNIPVDITDVVGDAETLTSLTVVSSVSGTKTVYTLNYKDETGASIPVDITDVVGDAETLTSLTVASSVSTGKTSYTLTYKDEEGTPNTINITDLIGDTTETLTTLISNGNGTYTYKDEGGEESYITVVADVINNAGNIFNDSDVKNIIKANETLTSLTVVSSVSGTKTVYTLTYKDEKGTNIPVDITDVVGDAETLTSLTVVSSVSGTKTVYTLNYKDETGASIPVDITDVVGDAETLTSLTVASSVSAGKTSYTLTYKDEEGTPNTINITDLIGDTTETLTTLISNGNGTYTYKDEGGEESYITVVADVINNAGIIFNDSDVKNIIKANETLTSLTVVSSVSGTKTVYTLTYKDEKGTNIPVDITDVVGDAETLTKLTSDGNGTYTYENEGGEESYITVVADVINNAGSIFNDSDVKNIIKANETLTSLTVATSVSGTKTVYILTYKDETGANIPVDITDVVGDAETLTSLTVVSSVSGTKTVYTLNYKDETGADIPVDITDVVGDAETLTSLTVTSRVDPDDINETIYELTYKGERGDPTIINIKDLVGPGETLTTLTLDNSELNNPKLIYKDETGADNTLLINDIVKSAETLTTLVVNASDVTLDYKNESTDPPVSLDISPLVREPWYGVTSKTQAIANTEDIYTEGWVGIGFKEKSSEANEKLRVNGAITSVNVYFPDYVFEDYFEGPSNLKADYKFKSLDQVDQFIRKNKHLPGIKPITELEKTPEGYSFNLSELSIQSLEKIEELYLHAIELQNEIKSKDKKIEALESALEKLSRRFDNFEKNNSK